MADFGLSFRAKEWFLDSKRVEFLVDKDTAQFLNRVGGNVRTIARRSMRRRKKGVSAPGQPPLAHTGKLRDGIWYAYDPKTKSVVVGPTRFNQISYVFDGGGQGRNFRAGAIPAILEFGGLFGVREILNPFDGQWKRIPWSTRLRDKLVPVWKATPKEKAVSTGVKTIVKGKHAVNFYIVPVEAMKSRLRWATIKPRPYMSPALQKSKSQYAALWGGSTMGVAA